MLRKTILALAATAAIGVSTLPATDASAHRYGGWHRGWHHSGLAPPLWMAPSLWLAPPLRMVPLAPPLDLTVRPQVPRSNRPCNAGPVRQRLHGPRNFDARG